MTPNVAATEAPAESLTPAHRPHARLEWEPADVRPSTPRRRPAPGLGAVLCLVSAADAIANAKSFDDEVYLEAASAKIRCAEAAEKGGAIAHQVHGAIGFTMEHILHRYSLRALAWRDDFGSESHWAVELGKLVASRGADELWPLVASR